MGDGNVTVEVCPTIGPSVAVVVLAVILPVTTPPRTVDTTVTTVNLMSGDCVERIVLAVVRADRRGWTVRLTFGVICASAILDDGPPLKAV